MSSLMKPSEAAVRPPTGRIRRRASCPALGCPSSTKDSILRPPSSPLTRRRRRSITTTTGGRTPIIQWVLDTRPLWARATRTAQLADHAACALSLLPPHERQEVLRYVHVRDAKMALGSRLLKRYLIARYASVPWDQAVATRGSDTKPVFRRPDGSEPLSFNVSHQAGLVVLVASVLKPAALGVDVVCPTERRDRDLDLVRAEGWGSFVDMHAEVFGRDEVSRLHGLSSTLRDRDHRLRYFYTLWCIREAYVKMTGEALLAPWLGDLEMRYFVPAEDASASRTEIWFRGRRVDDVDLDLVNVLGRFTVCTAVRRGGRGAGELEIGEYELLDVEEVMSFGERSRRVGWSGV